MKNKVIKFMAIFLAVVLAIISLIILFVLQGFRVQIDKCDSEPLAFIQDCKIDHSSFTWMNSGWWYPFAATSSITKCVLKLKVCTLRLLANSKLLFFNLSAAMQLSTTICI
jgi:hypothetical protein